MSDRQTSFDILIYCIGYESRSSHVASEVSATNRLAIRYERNCVLSFEHNLSVAEARGDRVIQYADLVSFPDRLSSLLKPSGQLSRVALDVSSLDRRLMGILLSSLTSLMLLEHFELTLLYSVAQYAPPQPNSPPFVSFAPLEELDSWTAHPERPVSMILGIGYEQDHALGALEYLDPSYAWVFVPKGFDDRFDADLKRSNTELFALIRPELRVDYWIENPSRLYEDLRALAQSAVAKTRVVIVPGGPKIFSAVAMLVKLEIGPEATVWRTSSHEGQPVRDVLAAGRIIPFRYPTFRQLNIEDNWS